MSSAAAASGNSARLTSTIFKWLLASHLSAISAWFLAFGASVLIGQSQDNVTADVIRNQVAGKQEAADLNRLVDQAKMETAINWVPVGAFGWLVFAVGALVLTLILFLSTGLVKGLRENLSGYKLIWGGLIAAGTAFVAATISNVVLAVLGHLAPWLFLVPGILALVGSIALSAGLLPEMWRSGRTLWRQWRASS